MAQPPILSPEQLRTLDRLRELLGSGPYYLAGGVAIAHHLSHRRSRDLDIFSTSPVDIEQLRQSLTTGNPDLAVIAVTDAALQVKIGEVPVDIVSYPHAPLAPPEPGPSGFATASLLDLATMKLSAIARRGIRRDFWDLYAILTQSPITLDTALDAYTRRFSRTESDLYHVLRSLAYFTDANNESIPLEGLSDELWMKIQSFLEPEAREALRRRVAAP